jgi:hypothetical protein
MKLCGFKPKFLNLKLKLFACFSFVCFTTLPTVLVVAKVIATDDNNIVFVSIMQIIPAYLQIQTKSLLFVKNNREFEKLFESFEFLFNLKIEKVLEDEFKRLKTIIKIFGSFIFISSMAGIVPPLLTHKLTIEMWQPQSSFEATTFVVFWIFQSLSSMYCIVLMFIFDGVTLSSIILVQAYSKFLKSSFSSGKFNRLNGKTLIIEKANLHLNLQR